MSSETTNKFIVAISEANAQKRDAISDYVKGRGYGYWHWMPDIWLLTTSKPVTAEQIRNALMRVARGINILVTPVVAPPEGMPWALYAPDEWAEWLEKNWK